MHYRTTTNQENDMTKFTVRQIVQDAQGWIALTINDEIVIARFSSWDVARAAYLLARAAQRAA
jgi:hypothetical protein